MRRALVAIVFISFISGAHAQTSNECLASAIFYEANLEPLDGQRAVFEVIQNRSKEYGMTVCQVVKQKNQFSWVGKKPFKRLDKEMKELLTSVKRHRKILIDEIDDERMYLYFFSKKLKPKWARRMQCRVIANHKFCKLKLGEINGRTKVQSR